MRVLMKKFKKSFDMAEPKPMTVELEVGNTDRAFGTILAVRSPASLATPCRKIPSM